MTIDTVELEYRLDTLPNSQHRAGLAALILLHRWGLRRPGVFEVAPHADGGGAVLRLDAAGLGAIYDAVYATEAVEISRRKPIADREPIRVETHEKPLKGNGVATYKLYIYEQRVPSATFLPDFDTSPGKLWIRLWRDTMKAVIRKSNAYKEYKDRYSGDLGPDPKGFRKLVKDADTSLSGSLLLGVQEKTQENALVKDSTANTLLLHLWPLVSAFYAIGSPVGRDGVKYSGLAIAVPDVRDLHEFCDGFEAVSRARDRRALGYWPRGAVVETAEIAGLDFTASLIDAVKRDSAEWCEIVSGIDVYNYLYDPEGKKRNQRRLMGRYRVEPDAGTVDRYRSADLYGNFEFRAQYVLNVVESRPWWNRIGDVCIENWNGITRDAQRALKIEEGIGPRSMSEHNKEPKDKTLATVVYKCVGTLIRTSMERRGHRWSDVKELESNDPNRIAYDDARKKIGLKYMHELRGIRTGPEITAWVADVLCGIPQNLDAEEFGILTEAILTDSDSLRNLALIALSARS